jgi:hypothetical protein
MAACHSPAAHQGGDVMNLETFKFGMGIAAVILASIVVCFAIYWKLAEASQQRARRKKGLSS